MTEQIIRHLAPTLVVDVTNDAGNAMRSMWAWHQRWLDLLLQSCDGRRVPWINWDTLTLTEFFPPLEIPQ